MSSVPTGTGVFSIRLIICPMRWAKNTPRRRIPTSPKSVAPSFFSMISCTRRTSVRSISDADINCAFWRRFGRRSGILEDINAASYAGQAGEGKTAAELADAHYEDLLKRSFREAARVLKPEGVLIVMFTHKRVDAWDTLGAALLDAGFAISASWPVHTESEHSLHQAKKNAATSTIFLACYLYYHFHVGSVHFRGTRWSRPLYFSILISHTVLAAVVVPMILITLALGLRNQFDSHQRLARWTYPIWMYVSVTGVIVYLMLYKIFV